MMAARAREANPGRQSLELSTFDAYATTKRTPLTYSPTRNTLLMFRGQNLTELCLWTSARRTVWASLRLGSRRQRRLSSCARPGASRGGTLLFGVKTWRQKEVQQKARRCCADDDRQETPTPSRPVETTFVRNKPKIAIT
jgi:hypothetical protein